VSQRKISGGLSGRDPEMAARRRERQSRGRFDGRAATRPGICSAKLAIDKAGAGADRGSVVARDEPQQRAADVDGLLHP
jgi:hypothetical protein